MIKYLILIIGLLYSAVALADVSRKLNPRIEVHFLENGKSISKIDSIVCFVKYRSSETEDTFHFIKVHFLYGSKPLRKYKDSEDRVFGGIHGGHSTIQVDDIDYGFEPATNRVHIFSRKEFKSDFVDKRLNGANLYRKDSKTVTFIIPINDSQYQEINRIHKSYCDTTPYDYAFFGMRCAAATQDILGQIGVVKKKKRRANIATTFYPKKLRKRLFKLAKKYNYQIIKNEGEQTRKWESD